MVLSRARFMLPRPRVWTTGRSGLLVTVSGSCMTTMSGPWRLSQIRLQRWIDCQDHVLGMLWYPWLARSPYHLSPSLPLWWQDLPCCWHVANQVCPWIPGLFLNGLMWEGGGLYVLWMRCSCMYLRAHGMCVMTVMLVVDVNDRGCHDESQKLQSSAHLKWSHSWCHGGSCCPGLSLP